MRWLFLTVSVLLACRASADGDSDVLDLTAANFADSTDTDIILVEFFAPWCGHCKRLAPEYEKAATALAKEDPPIPLAKVDCPANNDLCSKYGVSGYPTLKIFRGGELSSDYEGPRTADGIVAYMKKQGGPSSKELANVEAMKKFLDNEEYSIVGFFAKDSKLKEAFMTTASALRNAFRFAHVVPSIVRDQYNYNEQIVIFQPPQLQTKLDEPRIVYEGASNSREMQAFIKSRHMGIVGVRTTDNQKLYEDKKPLVVAYFIIDYVRNPKGTNYWRNRVIKAAKQFPDQLTFAVSDRSDFGHELQALGFEHTVKDVVVGLYDAKGQKYAMEQDFSVDNLKAFAQEYLDGGLEPYLKSEPVPKDNDGPVKVIVGKNFDAIVNDPTKDVLIEFYAPWCGHCKALAPKFEELGEKLMDDPNIVIAKSDATANDYPAMYKVQGYPTLFWVPKGNKSSPQKYEGGREVADFIKFIKDNATSSPPVVRGEEAKKSKKKGKKQEL